MSSQSEENAEIEQPVRATDEVDSKLVKTSDKLITPADQLVTTSMLPEPTFDNSKRIMVERLECVSRQTSSDTDLMEPQQPDDGSDISDYSKQLSASSDTDPAEQAKHMTSILDSIVQEAEALAGGHI